MKVIPFGSRPTSNRLAWSSLKRLSLGVFLIALSSSVLLLSDLDRRKPSAHRIARLALLQHASQPVLDEGVQGMLDGLAENGFADGKGISLRRFNAENDIATANAIAKDITNGQYDYVLTASTLSLQAVANANQAGKAMHIFGVVTDPFGAGVGISRENPLKHPRHLVGFGSFLPVADAFRLARKFFPPLRSVGLVWNTAESNSEAYTHKAREICRELGIDLLEANVDNSSGVFEAASSLVARGAQALWLSGDVTVLVAADSVIGAATKGRIPVFSIITPSVKRGTLFDLGANFYEVGKLTGALAAQILNGADPATIPVRDVVPRQFMVNTQALKGLTDSWRLPEDTLRLADAVVDEAGFHEKTTRTLRTPPEGRTFKVGVVYFAPEPGQESCMQGLMDGLRDLGFIEGKNLEIRKAHAQGEIANIPSVLQNYVNQELDLIIPMTTPCLTAACNMVKAKPVVFTYVYDPIAAGAGRDRTDHIPNITGVGSFPPVGDTVDMIRQIVPNVKAVGTLYNSSEANSRKVVSVARDLFRKRGIQLREVAITNTSEVFQAAQVLATRDIQALWITGDNTALQAFEGIVKVATDSRLPLVINDPEFVGRGALACVGLGFYQSGYAAAKLAARVLLGENPKNLPLEDVAIKTVSLNSDVAKKLGITFPAALIKEASR
jgi:ABC-type uncharacterized transport system substrate-binding protein